MIAYYYYMTDTLHVSKQVSKAEIPRASAREQVLLILAYAGIPRARASTSATHSCQYSSCESMSFSHLLTYLCRGLVGMAHARRWSPHGVEEGGEGVYRNVFDVWAEIAEDVRGERWL